MGVFQMNNTLPEVVTQPKEVSETLVESAVSVDVVGAEVVEPNDYHGNCDYDCDNCKYCLWIGHDYACDGDFIDSKLLDTPQDVHNRICGNFATVDKCLYQICLDFKVIRDNKYYKDLGYDTFDAYCLENFNVTTRQSYKYISIADNLSSDFVKSTSQIGTEKLYFLSRLTEEERIELLETIDVEHTSAKEVQKKAKELKDARGDKPKENSTESMPMKDYIDSIQYENIGACKDGVFWCYNGLKLENNLLEYYKHLTKHMNKIIHSNTDDMSKDDLLNQLSDLFEVARRISLTIGDLKDNIKCDKKYFNNKDGE